MATITIRDTHKVINVLQEKGFTKEQAEGFVEVARELDMSEFATAQQLDRVEKRIGILETKFNFMLGLNVAIFATALAIWGMATICNKMGHLPNRCFGSCKHQILHPYKSTSYGNSLFMIFK